MHHMVQARIIRSMDVPELTDSAGLDDTRNQPHPHPAGSSGTTGESSVQNAIPRAAGAVPTRGAQPSGQRTICQLCHRRVFQVRNGEWYHARNASAFCQPGDGSHRKVVLLRISESS